MIYKTDPLLYQAQSVNAADKDSPINGLLLTSLSAFPLYPRWKELEFVTVVSLS